MSPAGWERKKPCGGSELREAPYGECEVSPHFTGRVSPVLLAPGQWKLNPPGVRFPLLGEAPYLDISTYLYLQSIKMQNIF